MLKSSTNQTLLKLLIPAKEFPQSLLIAFLLFIEILFFKNLDHLAFLNDVKHRLILVGLTGFLFFFTYLWESSTARLPYRRIASPTLGVFLGIIFWYWITHKKEYFLNLQFPFILSTLLF